MAISAGSCKKIETRLVSSSFICRKSHGRSLSLKQQKAVCQTSWLSYVIRIFAMPVRKLRSQLKKTRCCCSAAADKEAERQVSYDRNVERKKYMKWRRPKRSGNLNRHVEVEKYKIFNSHCSCTGRSSFFSERVTDIWNSLPSYVVHISSLASFKRSVNSVNFFLNTLLISFMLYFVVYFLRFLF